jgi:hypothetical protein
VQFFQTPDPSSLKHRRLGTLGSPERSPTREGFEDG